MSALHLRQPSHNVLALFVALVPSQGEFWVTPERNVHRGIAAFAGLFLGNPREK
jgi:hypothetical protein